MELAELLKLAQRANALGSEGKKVVGIIPPQTATQSDYTFILRYSDKRNTATESLG